MAQSNRYRVKAVTQPDERNDRLLVGLNVLSGDIAVDEILTSLDNASKWRIDSLARYEPSGEHDPTYFIVAMERVKGKDVLKAGDLLISE